jgi:signal transduction histidine kinase
LRNAFVILAIGVLFTGGSSFLQAQRIYKPLPDLHGAATPNLTLIEETRRNVSALAKNLTLLANIHIDDRLSSLPTSLSAALKNTREILIPLLVIAPPQPLVQTLDTLLAIAKSAKRKTLSNRRAFAETEIAHAEGMKILLWLTTGSHPLLAELSDVTHMSQLTRDPSSVDPKLNAALPPRQHLVQNFAKEISTASSLIGALIGTTFFAYTTHSHVEIEDSFQLAQRGIIDFETAISKFPDGMQKTALMENGRRLRQILLTKKVMLSQRLVQIELARSLNARRKSQLLLVAEILKISSKMTERPLKQIDMASHHVKSAVDQLVWVQIGTLSFCTIQELVSWTKGDKANNLSAESKIYQQVLDTHAQRLNPSIGDVLGFAGTSRKKTEIRPIEVRNLAFEKAQACDSPKRFRIHYNRPPQVLNMRAGVIEQSTSNLTLNAVKHRDHSDIWIKVLFVENDLLIHADGDGLSIPAKYQSRVFELFQTLCLRDEVEGNRVSLAIVKNLIEAEQGNIVLISDPEKQRGAPFQITIPVPPIEI